MSGGADLGSIDWLGDGLALAGGITGSMYFVIGGEVRQRVGVLPYMSGVTLVATLALSLSLFGTEGRIVPSEWKQWLLLGGLIWGRSSLVIMDLIMFLSSCLLRW